MPLKFYNALTKKVEKFVPIENGKVGVYSCGPTVYWYPHIGNMKAYVNWDVLIRVLKFLGYKVKHVMNVTDVGHLTSDSDTGEDKIEEAANKEGKTAKEISEFYFKAFRENMEKLNIHEPDVWCKATDHIREQIEMIETLERKGYTYKTKDGIYFDTSKFKDYGILGNLNLEKLQGGKRVELGDKKNKTDFALWKFSEETGRRQQEWNSPWGIGFPGWHIECSAMSVKYLGEHFDIHTGGQDHIQVHHTNEIAQTECATGKTPWVNYWLHNAWLLFKGEKVSKSKGGLLILPELEEKGFDPLSFRYFVFQTNYRKLLEFSLEHLQSAQDSYQRLKRLIGKIKEDGNINKEYLKIFQESLEDDLNTSGALNVLWKLVRDKNAEGKIETIKKMDEVFGLKLLEKEEVEIPEEILRLANERENTRKEKNWKRADEIRDEIKSKGFEVADGKNGWELKNI